MAYEGWLSLGGEELVNASRVSQLAESLGTHTVWTPPTKTAWLQSLLGGVGYGNVGNAPWYDSAFPASGEFAGAMPLSVRGLEDDGFSSDVTQFVGDGGNPGRGRTPTRDVVVHIAVIASTERGAEFGYRWLARQFRLANDCGGSTLQFLSHGSSDARLLHLNRVRATRGLSVTKKTTVPTGVVWLATVTLTAGDPYIYGEPFAVLSGLGTPTPSGSTVGPPSATDEIEEACPVYSAAPVFDPLYPSLVAPPSMPQLTPPGWFFFPGAAFRRHAVVLSPPEPSGSDFVPFITFEGETEARMIRVSIWPADESDFCEPLFRAVLSYKPGQGIMVIDGERRVPYLDVDGSGSWARRADSLVYDNDMGPIRWNTLRPGEGMLVTLDIPMPDGVITPGGDEVVVGLRLIEKYS